MHEIDVAILGGGPCGSAAALTLLRYTKLRVAIVERSTYESPRVGETVSSALIPILHYLDAPEALAGCKAVESFSNAASWGTDQLVVRDLIFTGRGTGWHLDRRTFDHGLAETAEQRGARFYRGCLLRSATRADDGRWILSIDGAQDESLLATQVIDASGRNMALSRYTGAQRIATDSLLGIVAYFTGVDRDRMPHSTVVEAEPEGWWYGALIPGDKAVVAFMTDADQTRELGVHEWQTFYKRLSATTYIAHLIASGKAIEALHIHSASSQRSVPCIGENWVAAGDAAASFDPLSSLGIGHAISSGIQAARIVDGRLRGDEELGRFYEADIARFVADFQHQRQDLYRAENRWPSSPFWTKRQND